jgi:aryl-alcohol dehydrogenase-like predicted oxidoreductase
MQVLQKRKLGNTDLLVSELGLGAMDTPFSPDASDTVHCALDHGINFIDTARIYQNSEYVLGQVIRERGTKDFYIASKTINRSSSGAQHDVDKSLSLLGVNNIDVYQLDDVSTNDWETAVGENGALEGLKIAQARGLISYIGLSSHDLSLVSKAIVSELFDTIMIEYSAFHNETLPLLDEAFKKGLGIIAMRPLGGSGRTSSIENLVNARKPCPVAISGLLAYTLSNKKISVAIVGSSHPQRVIDNVATGISYTDMNNTQLKEYEKKAATLY